jgi:hypothetical protein
MEKILRPYNDKEKAVQAARPGDQGLKAEKRLWTIAQ